MKTQPSRAAEPAALRRRAEERLQQRRLGEAGCPAGTAEAQRQVHELQVHQIELEMLNDELQRAEAELGAALARYTDLYDFAPAGYFALDREGVVRGANLTGANLLGVERSRLLNCRFCSFVADADRPACVALIARAFASGAKESAEVALASAGRPASRSALGGEGAGPLWVQIEATVSEDGQECRAVVVDVSARKRAEAEAQADHLATLELLDVAEQSRRALLGVVEDQQLAEAALRESEAKYRDLVENLNDVIFSVDTDGIITYVSPAARQLAGYAPAELVGQPYSRIIHPDDLPALERSLRDTLENRLESWEFRYRAKGGQTRWARTSSRPILQGERVVGIRGLFSDITERKQLEEARGSLQAQLTQAQKMESVGRLAGGVAHDFNNLLMGIMNYTELCRDALPPEHPIRPYLNEITSDAQRSATITRQLLAFARKQTISPKVLDLNDALTGMLKMLRHLIGEDIDLAWMPGAALWPVEMDPGQLDQILANLCVNARDAIAGVGRITIETANVRFDPAYCARHTDAVAGAYVLLAVSDNGCGMNREVLAHLFEPFFTTKPVGQGTGLGLATVYGIVEQNRGHTSVYSEPGLGTTFKIYLPRSAVAVIEPASVRAPAVPPRGDETILLVEDERSIRITTRRFLEPLGYTVLVAATPAEAISLAAAHSGPIHLLITDVVMPGMSGRDLAERLLEQRPGTRCLFMSGYTANVVAHHGILDPNVHFIGKPFSRNELAFIVREVIGAEGNAPASCREREGEGNGGIVSSE